MNLNQMTGIGWAPDGSNRLFVIRKTGQVMIVQNGTVVTTPFATLGPVFTNSECGLVGFTFDPGFASNGHIYFFITVSNSEQQIHRYTASGNSGTNRTVIKSGLPTVGNNHDGGGIGIGPDGKLYWAIGDLGNGTGVDTNLSSLAAKVGRSNRDGSLPQDNPFNDGAGSNNDFIWARGVRNPFTMTFQPGSGKLWVNVVGTSYEQVFVVSKGTHAGYNDYENNQPVGSPLNYLTPAIKYRTNGTDIRSLTGTGASRSANVVTFTTNTAHGFRMGERITITGVADGSFNGNFFVTSAPAAPTATTFTVAQAGPNATSGNGSAETQNQGGCISGGTFWDSTAAPAAYRGNFFYGDYNSGRMMRAILNGSDQVTSVDYLSTSGHLGNYIDTAIGPDGAIYYASVGNGQIRRASFIAAGQGLIVTPTWLQTDEGSRRAFTVRLATAPAANLTVTIARSAGDGDLNVVTGANLTFTPGNFAAPQIVMLEATQDADALDDQ
ncbi:MAG: PQQ-dependent sugar dehydrogenase, partial [Opitutaceae bacterium]|nr:PQQ-dependent sugar dehydrogenase [Verrucomicrobiales bacterium]